MKILHILGDRKLPRNPDTAASSGIVTAVLETARAQVELGHQVWVASVVGETWKSEWQGVQLLGLAPVRWAVFRSRGRTLDMSVHLPFVYLTRRRSFDLVIGNGYVYLRLIRASFRAATFHSSPNYTGRIPERDQSFSANNFRRIVAYTDAQMAVSRFVAEKLREGLGSSGNIIVVYNGVDLKRFNHSPIASDKATYRRAWEMDENAIAFLYAGAIVEEKGVVYLAHAFAELSCTHRNFHLIVAGGSLWNDAQEEYGARVRSILSGASQRGQIHFLGMVDRATMPRIYASSDIVIMPSIWEAFGLVALEAFASGKPVIASNVGGLPEVVTSDVGTLIPAGDETLLRSAMLRLAQDEELRSKMGLAARKRAEEFSWNTTAQTIDAVYHEVLQRRKGR